MFEYLQEAVMENDATYMENCLTVIDDCVCAYETATTRMDYDIITESFTGAIGNLVTKIANAFRKVVDKITSLFRRDQDEALNKKIRSNPELAKVKVKVGDQDKLNKLYDDCNKKLEKGEDPNKVLAFFKDHSKQIIAGTLGAITISLGGFLVWKRKSNDKSGKDVDKEGKLVVSNLNKWFRNLSKQVGIAKKGSDPARISGSERLALPDNQAAIASAQATLANMMGASVAEINREHYAACAKAIKNTMPIGGQKALVRNAINTAPGRIVNYDSNKVAFDRISLNKESVDDFDDYLESSYEEFSADYDYDYDDYDDYM